LRAGSGDHRDCGAKSTFHGWITGTRLYVGGVFRSTRVLERFRMLMEFEIGKHGGRAGLRPAAGALLEAYRIAGVTCQLKNVPNEK
jgi:hypothetical protein